MRSAAAKRGWRGEPVGFEVLGYATCRKVGQGQAFDFAHVVEQSLGDAGYVILRKMEFGTECFCFDGEVHDDRRGIGWRVFGECDNGVGMRLPVVYGIVYRFPDDFDARVGHDRDSPSLIMVEVEFHDCSYF